MAFDSQKGLTVQGRQPWELDFEWLDIRLPNATEEEKEEFVERVAIKNQDASIPERKARNEAKQEAIEKRSKHNGTIYRPARQG